MRICHIVAAAGLLAAAAAAGAQTGAAPDRALALGAPISGALTPADRQRSSGKYEDVYTIAGRRGDRIELRLGSTDFDPYLLVTGPAGYTLANDDDPAGGGALDSRLVLQLPADGSYRISVTSFRAGATGAYQLSAATAPAGATASVPEEAAPIALGAGVEGSLARSDAQSGGRYVDRYRFAGHRGQRVALAVTSGDFDTVLALRRPDGDEIANDDTTVAGRTSTNSRLETALAEDGDYTVLVSSYRDHATGKYRLTLQPSEGSARQAAVRGGPRVFALLVGVSDYGGRTNDLSNTDQDATRIGEALVKGGLLNPASVTLTNAQATRAAVAAAMARIAAQAGPDDLFLFFFSGHGDQIPAVQGASELDGLTETIELRDAALTDRELAAMFARIRTRNALIMIDSCFSGGFRELVNRPGVMGLFSSEEDLTSDVASSLGSGGYLAHFLPGALTGEADIDGDRMLTAGELATYLRRQFARQGEISAITVDRDQHNLQNLVVERGGVQVDDVLLRLDPALPVRTAASEER